MKRTLRFAGLVPAVAALFFLAAAPAGANMTGGGQVNGAVTITSAGGIDLTTKPTTYQFDPIAITGTFADGANTFVGAVTTETVTGASPAENTISSEGTVGLFGFQDTLSVSGHITADKANGEGCSGLGGSALAATGGFTRVGSVVLVKLTCKAQLNGVAVGPQDLYVVAQFTPDIPGENGVTVPITHAVFNGAYATN
ncbi:MAG: hypothetical protein HYU28_07305 [Actinobacteria bacterium]|nr:hypothetical protein [Actinomycetota bacterium]